MKAIVIDNSTDMIAGMKHLKTSLEFSLGEQLNGDGCFHVKWMANIINLAVKNFMIVTHSKIVSVQKLAKAMQSSIQRHNLSKTEKEDLNVL